MNLLGALADEVTTVAAHMAKAFRSETVHVDGSSFIDCEFHEAVLVYEGGEPPAFAGCHFHDCRWELRGSAERTLHLLRFLAGESPDLRNSVLQALGLR